MAVFHAAGDRRDLAVRSKRLLTLAGEKAARGGDLFRPLRVIDNGLVVVRGGRVAYAGPFRASGLAALAPGRPVDAGDVCLMPGLVNAHTHIQLSWLAGRLPAGRGFAAWLGALVPLLAARDRDEAGAAVRAACDCLRDCGCSLVGDVGGSIPGSLPLVARSLAARGIRASHFCEWFGHFPPLADRESIWPPRCRADVAALERRPPAGAIFAPAGHALYSTAPDILARARRACRAMGRVFSFHLAESPEESRMLAGAGGPLHDLYRDTVLPPDWRAPGASPLAWAEALGLTGPGSLAVHGVQLAAAEARRLAAAGGALCLCPRSNRLIGVGDPDARKLIDSGLLLCLGTDGLSSNTDLDVRGEAVFLAAEQGIPASALVRMLTVNGAAALGLPAWHASLVPGAPGVIGILPPELDI